MNLRDKALKYLETKKHKKSNFDDLEHDQDWEEIRESLPDSVVKVLEKH